MITGRITYGLGAASVQQYLDLISQYESGNQNIPNYKFGPGFTAQGYYQITDQNWNNIAPLLGIDTSVYPHAMSAPQDVQAQVATYLLTQTPGGISNWGVNPKLMAALSAAGLQTSGTLTADGSAAAVGSSGPLVDLSGAAAGTSTASILGELGLLQTDVASSGMDLTSPVVIAAGLGVAALLLTRVL